MMKHLEFFSKVVFINLLELPLALIGFCGLIFYICFISFTVFFVFLVSPVGLVLPYVPCLGPY